MHHANRLQESAEQRKSTKQKRSGGAPLPSPAPPWTGIYLEMSRHFANFGGEAPATHRENFCELFVNIVDELWMNRKIIAKGCDPKNHSENFCEFFLFLFYNFIVYKIVHC